MIQALPVWSIWTIFDNLDILDGHSRINSKCSAAGVGALTSPDWSTPEFFSGNTDFSRRFPQPHEVV